MHRNTRLCLVPMHGGQSLPFKLLLVASLHPKCGRTRNVPRLPASSTASDADLSRVGILLAAEAFTYRICMSRLRPVPPLPHLSPWAQRVGGRWEFDGRAATDPLPALVQNA